jgi:hypothetical protein
MAPLHKGNLRASARRQHGGWVIEVWEDGIEGPIATVPQLTQPKHTDKAAALNAVIQGRLHANKDQAFDEARERADWVDRVNRRG